jgi:hypothetical protein
MSGEDDLNIFEKTWVLLVGICILRRSKNMTPIFLVQCENKVHREGGGEDWDGKETKRRRKRRNMMRKRRKSRVEGAGGG